MPTKQVKQKLFKYVTQSCFRNIRPTPALVTALYCNEMDKEAAQMRGIMFDDTEPDGFPKAQGKTEPQCSRHFRVPEEYNDMTDEQEKARIREQQSLEYDGTEKASSTAAYSHVIRPDRDDTEQIMLAQKRYVRANRKKVKAFGKDFMIAPHLSTITYADLMKRPYPNWTHWLEKETRNAEMAAGGTHQQA